MILVFIFAGLLLCVYILLVFVFDLCFKFHNFIALRYLFMSLYLGILCFFHGRYRIALFLSFHFHGLWFVSITILIFGSVSAVWKCASVFHRNGLFYMNVFKSFHRNGLWKMKIMRNIESFRGRSPVTVAKQRP